jgi:hypothetical protein
MAELQAMILNLAFGVALIVLTALFHAIGLILLLSGMVAVVKRGLAH